MKVHRLHIENFKAIERREVSIPDSGVLVLHGRNEVGKTSIIEAFDVLVRHKDSSRHREVKGAQPVGRDVPVIVEAEFSIGGDRVVYRKQWLKSPATTLRYVSGPSAGRTLSGGTAHDEADRLWQRTDRTLWDALRLMQADALDQASLTDSAALRAALDAQAGVGLDDDGASSNLVESVAREVDRWYTPQRKPNAAHRKAVTDQEMAAAEAGNAAAEVSSLARREEDLAQVVADVAHYSQLLTLARTELDELRAAASGVTAASGRRDRAARELDRAQAAHHAAAAALRARQQQTEEVAEATAHVERLGSRLTELERELAPARERLAEAERRQAEARDAAVTAQRSFTEATRDRSHLADLERLARLRRALESAERLREEIAALEARPPGGVDRDYIAQLADAERLVDVTQAELDAGSARIAVEALGTDHGLLIDGEAVSPDAGPQARPVVRDTVVEIPGKWRITVSPARGVEERIGAAREARARHRELLERGGVADMTDARRTLQERDEAAAALAAARAQRAEVLDGGDETAVRDEHDRLLARTRAHVTDRTLRHDVPAHEAAADLLVESATRALEAAQEALDLATAAEREARERVQAGSARLHTVRGEHETELRILSRSLAGLRQLRDEAPDEVLAGASAATAVAAEAAAQELARLQEELEALGAEGVVADLELAERAVTGLGAQLAQLKEQRSNVAGQLEGMGRDQVQARHDQAQSALAAADRELDALQRRARAALRLEEVLTRHQAAAHARYVQPFREMVELLGRGLYGDPDFGVAVSDSLEITHRRMAGELLPFEALSTGAKEQLVILIRLATAMLVDPSEGVPVMLDDALGHSDRQRLQRVGSAIAQAGERTQVVLLTANPERYSGLVDAVRVQL